MDQSPLKINGVVDKTLRAAPNWQRETFLWHILIMKERSLPPIGADFKTSRFSIESKQLSGPLRMSAVGSEPPPSQIAHGGGFAIHDWLLAQGRNQEAHDMEGLIL